MKDEQNLNSFTTESILLLKFLSRLTFQPHFYADFKYSRSLRELIHGGTSVQIAKVDGASAGVF